jgi:archaetidylinositol phosphate synthase
MLTKIKQKLQKILTKPAQTLQKIGVTPNKLTATAIILALLSAYTYTQWQTNKLYLLLAATLLLLSGLCDAFDGALARITQNTTHLGSFLDSLLDRYADAAIYVAIIISSLCNPLWGLIALTGTLLVSYTRAKAENIGIKMETIGIAERPERILILAAATIITIYWQQTLNYAIILLAILTNLTVLQRTIHTYKNL